jgi:hypothetical protein
MRRKRSSHFASTIITSTFLVIYFFLFLYGCKSPELPEELQPQSQLLYRDTVGVIYSRDVSELTNTSDLVTGTAVLYDPRVLATQAGHFRLVDLDFTQIGEHRFKAIIHNVLIQDENYQEKHEISVIDYSGRKIGTGERIVVQGAYELEIISCCGSKTSNEASRLKFRMSKE